MSSPEAINNGSVSPILIKIPANSDHELQKKVDALNAFFNFNTLTKPSTAEEKEAWKNALTETYSEITAKLNHANETELIPLITKVLTYNAHRLYGGDMNLTRLFFLAALSLQLFNLGKAHPAALEYIYQENTLDGLAVKLTRDPLLLNNLQEDLVKTLNIGEVVASCSDEQSIFDLAANLDWLGRSCQNLKEFNQNVILFKVLYGSAREAYTYLIGKTHCGIIKKEANWQIAENLYNTARHVYSLEHPGDLLGKLATLNELAAYLEAEEGSLRAIIKAAQIQNITAMEMWGALASFPEPLHENIKGLVFTNALQALTIAQQRENDGFDNFLLSMFYNNVASFGLETKKLTAAEAQVYSNTAIEKARNQGLDHYYFASFFKVGAAIARALDDEEKAAAFDAEAIVINTKFNRN